MSPSQDQSTRHRNQPPENRPQRRQAARPPRSRECLLKGCGKRFRPRYPMARYCSEDCRREARRWSQWKSRQRWRKSESGRKKRKQQSVRHRERLRLAGRASSGRKTGARGSSQSAARKNCSGTPVIVRAATRGSNEAGARHCSDSARMTAGAHSSACWSARDDGENAARPASPKPEAWRPEPRRCGYEVLQNVWTYCRDRNVFIDSA